ncbi:hypothetical protein D3C71_1325070 [compost metagenome]
MRRQGVTAHHGGQGQHHLDLVLVDGFEQPHRDPPQHEAQHDATARLLRQQRRALCRRGQAATGEHAQQQREQHHTHAIVEQRFAGDHQLQRLGSPGGLENAHHGNRIRGGYQRTKQQAIQQRHWHAHPGQYPPHPQPDDDSGQCCAHQCQPCHRIAVFAQRRQVHMQGARKQQERQHALHQHLGKIERAQKRLFTCQQTVVQARSIQRHQHQ